MAIGKKNISVNDQAKSELKTLLGVTNLEENQVTGVVTYNTKAELDLVVGSLNTSYKVTNDPAPSLNGYYTWNGSSYDKESSSYIGKVESGNTDAIEGRKVYDADLSSFVEFCSSYDSTLVPKDLAKVGDATPVSTLNWAYRAIEDGTIFGISNVKKGDLLTCRNVSTGYTVETLKALPKEIGRTLRLYNALDLSQATWSNGGFHDNGYNIDSYVYKARTNYRAIAAGTYYVRVREGYRFSCVGQDAGSQSLPSEEVLASTYSESKVITVTKAYIRVQIVKWTDGAIDTGVTFNVTDLSEILEIIQVLNKKDRISDLEDKVTGQETITAERIAPGAVESDGIKGAAVTPDKLSESYVKTEENSISVSGIVAIPTGIENIKLLSSIGATAYLRGKNFYDTVWSSGGAVTLLNQNTNEVEVSVTSGVYRNTVLSTKNIPIGTFTASVELEILTGSTAITPVLYLYRTGASPGSTASNMAYDSVSGKWKATITFTNSIAYDTRIEVQHSLGTSTDAYTCSIKTQIEVGSGNSAIVDYLAQDVVLIADVAQKIANVGYLYAYSADYDIYYSVTPIFTNESGTIVCWGDSLTEGTGSSTGKPGSDTNSDTSYPAVLGRLLTDGKSTVNMGVGGETSWKIAARHGAMPLWVSPVTIPATTDAVEVTLKGIEQNFFYSSGWTYDEDNLSYVISTAKGVNPCKIGGIEGTLSYSGGLFYFTRSEAGSETAFVTPKMLETFASQNYRNDIQCIWMGQNDAPDHGGQYILQVGSYQRARRMVDHCIANDKRYIVMNAPAGSDSGNAVIDQQYALEFGKHFINIRKYICEYGVDIANDLGAGITLDSGDLALVAAGSIPAALRIDGVHGNYWYYQIVARAVLEKGKDLGYWS